MRGLPNTVMGIVLAATAAALATIISDLQDTYTYAGVDFRLGLYAAVAGGLGVAGFGVYQMFGPPPKGAERARTDAQVIFRAMIALAGAGGKLHPDELVMIQRCCSQFFRREMSHTQIRKAFDHHQRSNYAGFAFDGADQRASDEACAWAFKAAVIVALADGEATNEEKQKLATLGSMLRLSADAQAQAGQEARQLHASLIKANG